MNSSYRSLWNDKTGTFVAVSENANSAGKKTSSCHSASGASRGFALKTLALSLLLSLGVTVHALPTGAVVAAGGASISSGALSTTITQSTQNVVINWQSFGIGSGEAVRFLQPNSNSVALNRVLGSDPSSILGSLTANGKVFLVNPNGILFGQGASVNVGGLVASTLNLSDSDFLAGSYKFAGAGNGTLLNQGTINADGGYVALLGANVTNNGVIQAKLGSVVLAAGTAITLDVAGDGLLNVTVNQGAVNALVQNGGLIQADGGQVYLTAQAAGGLLQSAVNNSGVIQAQTLQDHNGTIKLLGDMQYGTANVAGRLDASAPRGGDGGFIETSAAHVKIADNSIITSQSAQGKSGTWLIDPVDFTIATSGGDITPGTLATNLASNVTIASSSGAAGINGDINVNNDVTWSAATTLTLNAVRNVNLNAAVTSNTGSLVANAGTDVIVKSGVTGITANSGNITWSAGRDIQVNTGVTGITATSGNISWTAGRDININSPVTTTDGNFTACCGRDINITANMTTTRGHVVLKAGADGSGSGVAGVGGTVVFGTGILYTVTGSSPAVTDVNIYYTPVSYNAPHDYSGNFTGTASSYLTQHMLVFAQGANKIYDGNTNATLSFKGNPTLGGVVTLDAGVGATANFADKNVTSDIGISYSGYTLGGADAGKFTLWQSCLNPAVGTTSAAITARPVTVKADDGTKVYGQTFTPASTAFTVPVPPLAGETITSVSESTPGTAATVPVASYLITPSNATGANFNPANYVITYQTGTLAVSPAVLTVTAVDVSKSYGQTSTLTAFTTAGLVNGDTVTSVTETSPGAVATAGVAGSPYLITPSNATGSFTPSNYTLSYVNGRLTVTPVPLTVTASNVSKAYGQTPTLTAFSAAGLVNGDTVTSVTETSPGAVATAGVAGSPYVITPSGATGTFTASNYTLSYVNGVLTVTPIPLTVTASNVSKAYGQTPTLTAFSAAGLVNGDTVTSVTETSPGAVATAGVAGSPYPITPSNASGSFTPSNYILGYVNGVLTVTPIPLTVTASNVSKAYGQTPTLTAFSAAGLVNGDTVTSVTETSPGAIATAGVAGSPYLITPSNATGSFTPSNYILGYVNGVLTVTPVPLTVTASNVTKTYGQTPTLSGFTTTALVNGETVGSVTETSPGAPAGAPVAGSPYPITPSNATGGTFTPSNYTIGYVNGVLTVTPKALTGSITAADKIYDATTIAVITGRTLTGALPADVVSYTGGTATFDTPEVGVGKTVTGVGLSLAGADAGNYTVNSTATTTASITPLFDFTPPVVAPYLTPVNWIPVIVAADTPPELLTLAAPLPPTPVPAPPPAPTVLPEPAPVVVPVPPPPPEIYVAPHRPRKQDRN